MTVVSLSNHFSSGYAQVGPMNIRSSRGSTMEQDNGGGSGSSGPSSFPMRTGFRTNNAPDCKRTDSGYYSSSGGSMHSLPAPPSTPATHTDSSCAIPHPRTSSLVYGPPQQIPVSTVFSPYKMSVVSTPPIASAQEIRELFGGSAHSTHLGPLPVVSISQREFAADPLHPRFLEKYAVNVELGAGATGFVCAATRREDSAQVAVKFMYKDRIPITHWLRDRQLGGTVPLEIFILKRLDHPHVVKFLDFFEDKRFFYLVMETHGFIAPSPSLRSPLSPTSPTNLRQHAVQQQLSRHRLPLPLVPSRRHSQDLFDCIEQNPCMPERDIHHIFAQIASAVAHLHANNIVHRDIKDENIVVDQDLDVKLIDFGNAAYIPRDQSDYFDRFYGTMHCAAPEILRGERYRGPEIDVWAMGVLLYTLAFNQAPFRADGDIVAGRWAEPIYKRSEGLMRVLAMCLDTDAKTRATAEEVLASEWMAGTPATPVA
ncbi:hypothetical protein HDU89_004393 [Geranomyces variabilis]|nr:hypothetical protein HDU89_004393 [Geranomyces variabilis]